MVETLSAGASAEWQDTIFGASWLSSDNGLKGQAGDYSAWTAGVTHVALGFDWEVSTALVGALDPGGVLEVVRSGPCAMSRGAKALRG